MEGSRSRSPRESSRSSDLCNTHHQALQEAFANSNIAREGTFNNGIQLIPRGPSSESGRIKIPRSTVPMGKAQERLHSKLRRLY